MLDTSVTVTVGYQTIRHFVGLSVCLSFSLSLSVSVCIFICPFFICPNLSKFAKICVTSLMNAPLGAFNLLFNVVGGKV